MNSFQLLWEYRAAFAAGLATTTQLVLGAVVIGSLGGAALQGVCVKSPLWVRKIVDIAVFGVFSVPPLVILFWMYYPAQSLLQISLPPFETALVSLAIINSCATYRIYADADQEFPKQYIAAAMVCGLTRHQRLRYVYAPLVLRSALPRWIDQQVNILQMSILASLISVEEIFRVSQRINSYVYQPVLIYTAMALVFLAAAGSLLYFSRKLRDSSYREFSER